MKMIMIMVMLILLLNTYIGLYFQLLHVNVRYPSVMDIIFISEANDATYVMCLFSRRRILLDWMKRQHNSNT